MKAALTVSPKAAQGPSTITNKRFTPAGKKTQFTPELNSNEANKSSLSQKKL